MAVAGANAKWLPEVLGVVGRLGASQPGEQHLAVDGVVSSSAKSVSDAPINAIVWNAFSSAILIFLGDFRSLVTFTGLGEFTFFFLTVLGAVLLRFREPGLHRPYKPVVLIPILFTIVSGFVVVRGATFAPKQALIMIAVWVLGVLYYVIRENRTARRRLE